MSCPHTANVVVPPAWKDLAFQALFRDCRKTKECNSAFHKWMCAECFHIDCAKCGQTSREHFNQTGHPIAFKFRLSTYCYACAKEPDFRHCPQISELHARLYAVKHGQPPADVAQSMAESRAMTPKHLLRAVQTTVEKHNDLENRMKQMSNAFLSIVDELDMNDPKWSSDPLSSPSKQQLGGYEDPLSRDYSSFVSPEDEELAMIAAEAGISMEDAQSCRPEMEAGMCISVDVDPFEGWSKEQIAIYRKHAPQSELDLLDSKLALLELE